MIKVCLVGCGRISKRHIEAIKANDGIEISLVCDIDKDKAKTTADVCRTDYITDMKEMKNVDVAVIATPSGLHPEHVVTVSENCNIKYIVTEKPVSLTVRETVTMFKAAKDNNVKILPVFQNRYNPLVDFIKKIIDENKLGKIFQFNINVFWNRNEDYFKNSWHGTLDKDGGVLYTQASHYVDMMLFLFGKIKEAKGFGGKLRQLEVQDSVSAVCEFESGTVGTLNATVSTYNKNYLTELSIIGEKGTVRLSGTNLNTIDFWDVENMVKPDIDFKLDHIYGKGHDKLYEHLVKNRFDLFPTYEEVLAGISLMEKLSY